jgi:hypothetical protein
MSAGKELLEALKKLVFNTYPNYIIETGTYNGLGTTRTIAEVLSNCKHRQFYSIECNPAHYAMALKNLVPLKCFNAVTILNGLSVPRDLLPDPMTIVRMAKEVPEGVQVDYDQSDREKQYFNESCWPDVPDDLLGLLLEECNYGPSIVLLDSAGHLGNIEFNYVVNKLKWPCYFVLDDINHLKHYKSVRQMKSDKRFEIRWETTEKFGSCITYFKP